MIKINNGFILKNSDKFTMLLIQIRELMLMPVQREDFNSPREMIKTNSKMDLIILTSINF